MPPWESPFLITEFPLPLWGGVLSTSGAVSSEAPLVSCLLTVTVVQVLHMGPRTSQKQTLRQDLWGSDSLGGGALEGKSHLTVCPDSRQEK